MTLNIRPAEPADILELARIRAQEWETEAYWQRRIAGYLSGALSPQLALPTRTTIVALEEDAIVGFIAAHLTTRHACDGELQWIDVATVHRRLGIATQLLSEIGAGSPPITPSGFASTSNPTTSPPAPSISAPEPNRSSPTG